MKEIDRAAALIAAAPANGSDGPSGPALVAALRDSGLLAACDSLAHHPRDPLQLFAALVAVGRADLSAGRLFEGHVNAVKLLRLHDGPTAAVRQGLMHGIWGADGPDPTRIEGDQLRGQKLFASGADVLDRILVTARKGDALQLLLFDRETLQGRLFPEEWNVSGMKATASGRCDLNGVPLAAAISVGGPDDYTVEPHFHGGVWRYAAVQLGAMRALASIAVDQLTQRRQHDAPLQAMRVHQMITACETARLWLEQAALRVEQSSATAVDAEAAILARLITADEAVALINAVDRALGAASFASTHPADRIRRDLSFYLRQANPDGLALGAVRRILGDPDRRARWLQ